mmetsp:Transcript_14409/g.22656  ORF Transcript_14409/g.22656 Transcript_14409/m.22656 type:complete len:287 (+) Transcript_14409:615-1475(+)
MSQEKFKEMTITDGPDQVDFTSVLVGTNHGQGWCDTDTGRNQNLVIVKFSLVVRTRVRSLDPTGANRFTLQLLVNGSCPVPTTLHENLTFLGVGGVLEEREGVPLPPINPGQANVAISSLFSVLVPFVGNSHCELNSVRKYSKLGGFDLFSQEIPGVEPIKGPPTEQDGENVGTVSTVRNSIGGSVVGHTETEKNKQVVHVLSNLVNYLQSPECHWDTDKKSGSEDDKACQTSGVVEEQVHVSLIAPASAVQHAMDRTVDKDSPAAVNVEFVEINSVDSKHSKWCF